MRATYALFPDPDLAREAIRGLRRAGFVREDIVVMSSVPFEAAASDDEHRQNGMSRIAVLGGALGCATGVALTSLSQLAWPLETGGMPIVSPWPNLIITFELTMLGAIIATVAALVKAAGLGKRLPSFYDREVSNGKILVGVVDASEQKLRDVEQAFSGGEVKTVG